MEQIITYMIDAVIQLIVSDYYFYTMTIVLILGAIGLLYIILKK